MKFSVSIKMKLADGEIVKSYHQAANRDDAFEYAAKKLDDSSLAIASITIRPMPVGR